MPTVVTPKCMKLRKTMKSKPCFCWTHLFTITTPTTETTFPTMPPIVTASMAAKWVRASVGGRGHVTIERWA